MSLDRTLEITTDELQRLMVAALKAAREPGPLEQAAVDEQMQKEKRRNALSLELGYADDLKRWNQQHNCTHYRDKSTGNLVRQGESNSAWCTGGQILTNGNAVVLCSRCQTTWIFHPTDEEREYINNVGLLGFPPPALDRCVNKADFLKSMPVKPGPLAALQQEAV